MPKSADFIEQSKEAAASQTTKIVQRRGQPRHPNSLANLRPWTKGTSGNPGGRPSTDIAAIIARAILENNKEAAYEALGKALLRGNAYVFKELAERAYGKVTQSIEVAVTDLTQLTDEQLLVRLRDLEVEQGRDAND
jgi:hypothetical protein